MTTIHEFGVTFNMSSKARDLNAKYAKKAQRSQRNKVTVIKKIALIELKHSFAF